MIEVVEATRALLNSSDPTSYDGDYITLDGAAITDPRPVQAAVPLLVGGNGDRVLRFAAECADIVGITGLGRTLEDGHRHVVDWCPASIERAVEVIRATADRAGRSPDLEALVQHVEITDEAPAAAARLSAHVPGASVDDLLSAPFVWIGTIAEIRERLRQHHRNLGLGRFVVRPPTIPQVRQILED